MLRRWRGAWPRRGQFFEPPWAASTWPPDPISQQRRAGAATRRGRFFPVAPAAPPAYPPAYVRAIGRLAGRPTRRGNYLDPPWPQGPQNVWTPAIDGPSRRASWTPPTRRGQYVEPPWPQPWAPVPARSSRRAVVPLARRGRFYPVPPAVVAPAAPSAVPGLLRARSRWLPKPRRGVVYGPTWSPVIYGTGLALGVGAAGRPGRQAGPVRRGQQFEPPWTQVAAQPSVWRPPFVQAGPRRAGRPTRRGQFFEPPWVEGPQTVWRPGQIHQTPRLAGRPIRRGQYAEPPWPQGAQAGAPAWTPDFRGRRRPFSGGAGSRNRYQWTPPRPAGVPAWLRSRPRPVPSLARRGHFREPPWPQGPQSIWRPDPICPVGTRPKWPTHRLRRGRYAEPPWPQVPPPPFTIGALTARDAASGVLTAAGTAAALGATDATSGRLTTADDEAATLTATDQRGGPS